jgi:putative cell wall-binding protein
MNTVLLIVIFILLGIIVVLAIALKTVISKATYLSRKDKDFIIYALDIYIDYADELNVSSLDEHEVIVKQLDRIKENKLNDG